MQASTSRRTTAVEALTKQALGALGTISGIAAIAYTVGYLNRWAYFDTFGAGWLIGNLTIAEILPASFDGLLPLVMLAAVALVQSAERFHSERRLKQLLIVWCVIAVVFLLLDRAGRDTFVLDARALFSLAASFCVIFASVSMIKLGVLQLANDQQHGSIRATHAILAVGIAGFVFAPLLAGRADALAHRSDPARFSHARIVIDRKHEELPMLLATNERIFCIRLGAYPERSVTVLPITWENVTAVTARPKL